MKTVSIILLILSIITISFFFYKDINNKNVLAYTYSPDIQDSAFFYPKSEYLIEINELKQRQFQCNIWLKNLSFFAFDLTKTYYDSSRFESLLLRSYIYDSTLKFPYKVDWVTSFLTNKENEYCFKLPSSIETAASNTILWTPNTEKSIFYPFDYYKFHLNFEEQASYTGVVTNTAPEMITINCKMPNFLITRSGSNDFILQRTWTFKIISIVFIILIGIYTIYLWSRKSKMNVMAESIGLFTGVWSVRTIIGTDAPVFPTIIDYFTLIVFISLSSLLILQSVTKKT